MEKAFILAVIGVFCGVGIGEYSPGIFASGFGVLGAAMSEPFSPYRNDLAIKYAVIFGIVGFVVGLLIHIATKKETGEI